MIRPLFLFALIACGAPSPETTESTSTVFVPDTTDGCVDGDPAAPELCNGVDDNCNGLVDEESTDAQAYFDDRDGDGYGAPTSLVVSCDKPAGWVDNDLDCDDDNNEVNPDGTEICFDGLDNDCDGLAVGCAATGLLGAADADASFVGDRVGDRAGYRVAAAGDVNGDGFDDLWISAEHIDGGNPGAYLIYGPVSGTVSLALADVTFIAEDALNNSPVSIAGVGDVNGDGFDDLLISDKDYAPNLSGERLGAAYLFYGPVIGEVNLDQADVKIEGVLTFQAFGSAIAGVGDVNGDGFDDILITADEPWPTQGGRAYLYYGPLTASDSIETADAEFSGVWMNGEQPVSGAGDVNGDGLDDLLIHGGGGAYLYLGPQSGDRTPDDAEAELVGDRAGEAVASAGDVNGDGFADLIIGAPSQASFNLENGTTYLVHGPISGVFDLSLSDATFTGEGLFDNLGTSVCGGGDLDGDGLDDLVIGAPFAAGTSGFPGAAYVVEGTVLGEVDLATIRAKVGGTLPTDEYLGRSVAIVGDVNGDGYDDILVGAPGQFGTALGAAYLYFGGPGF